MNRKASYVCTLIIGILMLLPCQAAAETQKVAILPFNILAEKDYSFLEKAVTEMLTSRLSDPGKVEVVDPVLVEKALKANQGLKGEALASKVGTVVNSDFTIFGTITILGESVSIDSKVVDPTAQRAPVTFFKQTRNLGDVIPQIGQMAADINAQLFNVKNPQTSASGASPAVIPVPVQQQVTPDIHMHPEKLLQGDGTIAPDVTTTSPLTAGAAGQTGQSPGNGFIIAHDAAPNTNQPWFWKSKTYNYLINGLDVGDIDKDGLLETVVAAPNKILIYRFSQGRQQTVKEIDTGRNINIGIDIADINQNGTPEIIVTAFSVTLRLLESYILEYDGKDYTTIVKKSRYYYSVIDHPVLGEILLGQQQKAGDYATPFDAPIFEMKWNGMEYMPERKILAGGKANVLGLAYGKIMPEDNESFAILDDSDYLRVLSASGKTQWQSEDHFGGTTLYKAMPPMNPGDPEQRFFLPVRLRAMDLNKDGAYEVLAPNNHDKTNRLLSLQRFFKEANITAFVWNGLGMSQVWSTRTIAGRIQDFAVADYDNDGTLELLMANITKEGAIIFTDAKATLIAVDLK